MTSRKQKKPKSEKLWIPAHLQLPNNFGDIERGRFRTQRQMELWTDPWNILERVSSQEANSRANTTRQNQNRGL
ncbi:MAG: hypothetical protein CMJ62_00840 [Planctomycetaceae bacterium]|nr:hypothetical protein [Planctomycetaceae bacterium]